MDVMNFTRLRQMRTVFAQTKAEVSEEFLKNFEAVSAPLSSSQLEDIGKEAGVDLLSESGKFSLCGDWWSMISAYKLLLDLLNSVYGVPPIHTSPNSLVSDDIEQTSLYPNSKDKNPMNDKKGEGDMVNKTYPFPHKKNSSKLKTKVPDPIVLSVTSNDFTVQEPEPEIKERNHLSVYDDDTEPEDNESYGTDNNENYDDIDQDQDDVVNSNATLQKNEDSLTVKSETTNAERKEYVHKKLQASLEKKQQQEQQQSTEELEVKAEDISLKTKERGKLAKLEIKRAAKIPVKKNKRKGVPVKLSTKADRQAVVKKMKKSVKSGKLKQEDDSQPDNVMEVISSEDEEVEESNEEKEKDDGDNEWLPDAKFNDNSDSLVVKLERRSRGRPRRAAACKAAKIVKKKIRNARDPSEAPARIGGSKMEYSCPSCDYVAKKRCHFREHFRRNHRAKKWKCDECDRYFGIHKDLKRHQMTHYEPQHCCDTCGKMYKSYRTFLKHKKVHEDDYTKPQFPCDQCDKIFSTKYVLTYHVKAEHMGIKKSYLCPTCGKSFTQKNSYIQHANVHMGLKPHTCEVCNKSFAYEKSLKEHRYTHEEIKRFKCEVCDKTFRQSSALAIHMKVHKGDKDHLCGVCGKGFTQKQALYRHERIHNGDKPFSCTFCGRRFSDTSIIRRHMILVHKKDPKQWREGVASDLKGKEGYFIESYDGSISTGGRPVRDKETFELIPPPPKDKVFHLSSQPTSGTSNQSIKPKEEEPDHNKVAEEFDSVVDLETKSSFSAMVDRIIGASHETLGRLPDRDNIDRLAADKQHCNTETTGIHAVTPEPETYIPHTTTLSSLQLPSQAPLQQRTPDLVSTTTSSHGLSPQDEHMASVTAEYLRKQALLQAVSTLHQQEQAHPQGHASLHMSGVQHFQQDNTSTSLDPVPHSASYMTGNGSSDSYTDIRRKEVRDVASVQEHTYTQDMQQQVQDPSQRPIYDKNTGQWTVPSFPYLYMHQNYNLQYPNQNQQ